MTSAIRRSAGSVTASSLRARLRELAIDRFERSASVPTQFIHGHADLIARACLEMSERFQRGGRLLTFGTGAAITDARHAVVEFVHPVIVGKRALPAMVLAADESTPARPYDRVLGLLGHEQDIAMGIDAHDARAIEQALGTARKAGMLTIALAGRCEGAPAADFVFGVPTDDPLVVQEVHELLYHVLWELVHVFLEHRQPT